MDWCIENQRMGKKYLARLISLRSFLTHLLLSHFLLQLKNASTKKKKKNIFTHSTSMIHLTIILSSCNFRSLEWILWLNFLTCTWIGDPRRGRVWVGRSSSGLKGEKPKEIFFPYHPIDLSEVFCICLKLICKFSLL